MSMPDISAPLRHYRIIYRRTFVKTSLLVLLSLVIGLVFNGPLALADSPKNHEILCPFFTLSHKIEPDLSDVEKRLVCGDAAPGQIENEGWKTIPPPQAQFNLTNFLQDRGYLHPTFFPNTEKTQTFVELGDVIRVTHIELDKTVVGLTIERKRKTIGEPLTPALLGDLEKWVAQRLQALGYACPKVTTEANPSTGEIIVHLEPGAAQNLVVIDEEPVKSLPTGLFRRYDAFQLGQLYDGDLLNVTESRITSENLVQNTHFSPTCRPDGVHVKQEVVAGPPRILTAGVGINTEELLIGKLSWRNSRLGHMASWLDFTLLASAKEQSLTSTFTWFFLPYVTRLSLRPLIEVKHSNEDAFETESARAQIAPSTTWDNQKLSATFLLGPTLDFFRTLRGLGLDTSEFLSLEGRANLKTHDFEYYRQSPRSGFDATLITGFTDAHIYSQASAQRLRLQGQGLWNLNDYDPPLLVFGLRGALATVATSETPGPGNALPPNYLEYLGGSTDLRGYGRKELPTNGFGALTSAFLDLEIRLGDQLPYGVQPFTFLDLGMIGSTPFKLDGAPYWAPGAGIRLVSPIGVFRTTIAHGYSANGPGHFQFYLSFGEEF